MSVNDDITCAAFFLRKSRESKKLMEAIEHTRRSIDMLISALHKGLRETPTSRYSDSNETNNGLQSTEDTETLQTTNPEGTPEGSQERFARLCEKLATEQETESAKTALIEAARLIREGSDSEQG